MNKSEPLKLAFQAGNLCAYGLISVEQFNEIWDEIIGQEE